MESFGKRLSRLLLEKGVSQSDLARYIGVSPQSVQLWVKDQTTPKDDKLTKCAAYFGLAPSQLKFGEGNVSPGPDVHGTVPLISWVQAGNWQEVLEADGDIVQIPTTYKTRQHTYALRVEGDSMEPTFPRGCIIIVEPDEDPMPGQYVVVRQNGNEATFKQLIQDGGMYMLRPVNDRYPIMQMQQGAVFCGVVKQMMMEF